MKRKIDMKKKEKATLAYKMVSRGQAVTLKELGFKIKTQLGYLLADEFERRMFTCGRMRDWNKKDGYASCPTVCNAIRFIRQVRKIKCGVMYEINGNYAGWFVNGDGAVCVTDGYETYDEADSANLDALLEVKKKRL